MLILVVHVLAVNRPLSFDIMSKSAFCTLNGVRKWLTHPIQRLIHALGAFLGDRAQQAALPAHEAARLDLRVRGALPPPAEALVPGRSLSALPLDSASDSIAS